MVLRCRENPLIGAASRFFGCRPELMIMADIVFINPRFEVSYWGLEHALPLLGKK
jgi:hypothetical protein